MLFKRLSGLVESDTNYYILPSDLAMRAIRDRSFNTTNEIMSLMIDEFKLVDVHTFPKRYVDSKAGTIRSLAGKVYEMNFETLQHNINHKALTRYSSNIFTFDYVVVVDSDTKDAIKEFVRKLNELGSRFPLEDLPQDVLQSIAQQLDPISYLSLCRINRRTNMFCRSVAGQTVYRSMIQQYYQSYTPPDDIMQSRAFLTELVKGGKIVRLSGKKELADVDGRPFESVRAVEFIGDEFAVHSTDRITILVFRQAPIVSTVFTDVHRIITDDMFVNTDGLVLKVNDYTIEEGQELHDGIDVMNGEHLHSKDYHSAVHSQGELAAFVTKDLRVFDVEGEPIIFGDNEVVVGQEWYQADEADEADDDETAIFITESSNYYEVETPQTPMQLNFDERLEQITDGRTDRIRLGKIVFRNYRTMLFCYFEDKILGCELDLDTMTVKYDLEYSKLSRVMGFSANFSFMKDYILTATGVVYNVPSNAEVNKMMLAEAGERRKFMRTKVVLKNVMSLFNRYADIYAVVRRF